MLHQIANMAIGTGMGLLLEKHQDRRQLKQQEKLQNLQIQGQQQMADYNYQKQLQMWKDTNYKAQIEQLKEAGLNPGLLYGMGGSGGATTGSGGTAGTVTGGQASHESQIGGMGMSMLQMGLMKAQMDNIQADTEKKKAETTKTSGVDTDLTKTNILLGQQGIQNKIAEQKLTEIDTQIKKLDAKYLEGTMHDRMDIINSQAAKMIEEIDILITQDNLTRAQYTTTIDLLKQQLANAVVQNSLGLSQISLNEAEKVKWATELAQAWKGISQRDREISLKGWEADIKAKYPGLWNVMGRILNETANGIGTLFGQQADTNKNPIQQK